MRSEETDLTLVDLQNLRTIMDIAARRGAFAAAEMTSVGQIFTKLDTFIKNNEENAKTTEEDKEKKDELA